MKKITILIAAVLFSLTAYAEETKEIVPVVAGEEIVAGEKAAATEVETDKQEVKIENSDTKEEKIVDKFIRVKGAIGIDGEVRTKVVGEEGKKSVADRKEDAELMVEGVYRVSSRNEVAFGIGAQKLGNIDYAGTTYENLYSFPLYFSIKHNFFGKALYVKGKFGGAYNYSSDGLKDFYLSGIPVAKGVTRDNLKIENGLYYAVGLGFDLKKIEIEALYSVNQVTGSYMYGSSKEYIELDNARISLGLSYAFDAK